MKTFIDKELTLIELRRLQEEVKFNSFQYQVMVKAIKIVENQPNVFADLDTDDCK